MIYYIHISYVYRSYARLCKHFAKDYLLVHFKKGICTTDVNDGTLVYYLALLKTSA